jgi:hypothetical protein
MCSALMLNLEVIFQEFCPYNLHFMQNSFCCSRQRQIFQNPSSHCEAVGGLKKKRRAETCKRISEYKATFYLKEELKRRSE